MKKVRITAMRRSVYPDLIEKYENPIEHACDTEIGSEFVSIDGKKPDGLCSAAWESMEKFVEVLARGGGNFYDGWMKNEHSAMISCNDGFRPVSFYIETVEEREESMEFIWEKSACGEEIKILFVGDSLTYYNDMPMIFDAMAKSEQKNVYVDSITKGGYAILKMQEDSEFWSAVEQKIHSQKWDIIVYQPGRNYTVMPEYFPDAPQDEFKAAERMVKLIKKVGALPLQYSTFGVNKGSVTRNAFTKVMTRREHTDLVTEYNAGVADKLGVTAVYSGKVLNLAAEKYPEINLYHTDKIHPSYAGSFVVASCFYTVIFGEAPVKSDFSGELDTATAEKLKKIPEILIR